MEWGSLPFLALIFLGPIAALFVQITPDALRETLSSAAFPKALWITVASGAGAAAVSTALGVLFGHRFALYEWRGKRLQRLVLLIPYLAPNFILATAYVTAWNPVTGILNPFFRFPGGLYGLAGLICLFSIAHFPVAFLLLEEKLKRIDPALREAARLSGVGSAGIFFRIDVPLLVPTLISAFSLCFALNISAFAIPAWIGAPEHVYTLTYKVYQAIQLGGGEGIPQAAALSVALFLLAAPPLLLIRRARLHEQKYATVGGKASRKGERAPDRGSFAAFQALFWVSQILFWIAPLGALFASTLVKPGCLQESGWSCFRDFSFRSYRYVLFDLAETRIALKSSVLYGGVAAALVMAVSLGTLALLSRRKPALGVAEWVFALPVATPGAIIALGLIVTCSGRFGLNLYNTPWIVVAAYVIKHLNLAFQPLRTGLSSISPSLFEAARLSGARSRQIWGLITIPILQPEVLGGFFLVLIPILGELTMSVFLASPSFRSIGTVLFDLQDYADQASAAALSILLVVLVLLLNEASRLLTRGKLGY